MDIYMLSYAYQYKNPTDPYYSMKPLIGSYQHFATATGTAFLIPVILILPFGGIIADRANRRYLFIGSLLMQNLSSFITGYATSYSLVLAMRI